MNSYGFCAHCERGFWRKRKTKKYCSAACKQKAYRGMEPKPYWEIDLMRDRYEDFLADMIDQRPQLTLRLGQIKDRYGRKAMLAAIDCIHIALKGEGIAI